ncbi:MAG: PIN domain-containing protein [Planctomycetota bacterium]|nr:PIN domain-containing protein [Planctomycetota bacterium]
MSSQSRRLVLDSSAVLAAAQEEAGAENVRLWLAAPPPDGMFIHAVNACEVASKLIALGFPAPAAFRLARPAPARLVSALNLSTWRRAAVLRGTCPQLSLGDRICISFAETLGADILTGDRLFREANSPAGIRLFR